VRVEFDEENRIELLEREKDVIIHSGENVYPSEIENVLENHPTVSRAAVVGLPDDVVGEKIAAFIISKQSYSVDHNEVVEYLKKTKHVPPQNTRYYYFTLKITNSTCRA
jgi:acyl-CoA synthetase (AMP-forming)/AMP-acid ligase II